MFFRGCEQGFCSYFELVYDDLIVFVRAGDVICFVLYYFSSVRFGLNIMHRAFKLTCWQLGTLTFFYFVQQLMSHQNHRTKKWEESEYMCTVVKFCR